MTIKFNSLFTITFIVFLVFLICKLCGTIAWSWWWVTSPLWIYVGLIILVAMLIGLLEGINEWQVRHLAKKLKR